MKRFTSLFTSLALAAPLVLGAGIASAQDYRGHGRHGHDYPQQTYPQQTHPAPVYPAPMYPQAQPQPLPLPVPVIVRSGPRLVEKTGIVQSFLFSGRRVRGVMLTDGSAVLLRSANRSLTRRLAPGSLIRVRGFVMPGNATTIRNASILAVRSRAANPMPVYVTPARAPYYPPRPATVTVTPVAAPVYAPAPVPVRVVHRSPARVVRTR